MPGVDHDPAVHGLNLDGLASIEQLDFGRNVSGRRSERRVGKSRLGGRCGWRRELLLRRRVLLLRRRILLLRRRILLLRRRVLLLLCVLGRSLWNGRRRLLRHELDSGRELGCCGRGLHRHGDGRRRVLRLCDGAKCHDDARIAKLDLVARLENRLVDSLAIDRRSARGTKVDELNLPRTGDLDDRMHTRYRLVFQPEVRRGQLADLDHRLVESLLSHQLLPFENLKLDGDRYVGHGVLLVFLTAAAARGRRQH